MRSKVEDIATTLPATIEVAITLTKRDIKDYPRMTSHTSLKDAAYEQKVYQIRLNKGSFRVEHRTTYGANPIYEYQMLWDKSPYPPLEEWYNWRPAKGGRYWERNDFYKDMVEGTA
jgi:hypothetical protein